jgi:hypothetical protein
MTDLISLTPAQALDRLAAWQLAMRAENKSPATIVGYTDATTRYLRWWPDGDLPPMSRTALNTWISGMLASGAAPATARTRQSAYDASRPGSPRAATCPPTHSQG